MNSSREGRRIGKVQGIKIFHLCTHGNACNSDVHHLIHRTCAQNLNAQKLMTFLVRNQFGHECGRIGIIVGLVVSNAGSRDHIITCLFCLRLGQTGTARIQPFCQLHNTGSQTTTIRRTFTSKVLSKQATGNIGSRAHCGPLPLTSKAIINLGAITYSIYTLQIRFLELINNNRPPIHFYTGFCQPCCCRTNTDGQNHGISLKIAYTGTNSDSLFAAQYCFQTGTGNHTDPLGL